MIIMNLIIQINYIILINKMIMKLNKISLFVIFSVFFSIIFVEIFMRFFFGPPVRMQYDFSFSRLNSESDFQVTYFYDLINGYRDFNSDCKTLEEKVLIIGDSAAFAQGIEVKNTLTKLLDNKYCIENWSMIGKDLKFIKYNILQKYEKIKEFEKIIIILHDNDTQTGYNANKMNFASTREYLNYYSYSYNFFKIFRKHFLELNNKNIPVMIDGRINNPANLFNNNPDALKIWFDLKSNLENIENELNEILFNLYKLEKKVYFFVVPAPSVCSKNHRFFYNLHNVGWMPEYNQRSKFDVYIENKCNGESCIYLPLYSNICNEQINRGNIFFPRDFHLNENGQLFLYEKLMEYLN